MESITGQAGVSIFVTTMTITNTNSNFVIYDTEGGSIEFRPFTLSLTAATRNKTFDLDLFHYNEWYDAETTFVDTWSGGTRNLTVQHPLYDHVIINGSIENMDLTVNASMDDLFFNSINIGKLDLTNLRVSDAAINVFQHNGTGIDATFKTRFTIDQIAYTYDDEQSIDPRERLQFTGITAAGTFGGDPLPSYGDTVSPGTPINTGTWTPTGYFEIGQLQPVWSSAFVDDPLLQDDAPEASLNSFSIDFKEDNSPFIRRQFIVDWQGNYNPDPDGYIGDGTTTPHIANDRENEVYVDLGLPLKGSIRFETSVRYYGGGPATEADYGPSAIDGISGYTRIEAPGYGIGNSPTTSTLYE
ncbi:MAG: hypothetical protein ACOZF0_20830 [Thermodesulfobacteriota bacterium]